MSLRPSRLASALSLMALGTRQLPLWVDLAHWAMPQPRQLEQTFTACSADKILDSSTSALRTAGMLRCGSLRTARSGPWPGQGYARWKIDEAAVGQRRTNGSSRPIPDKERGGWNQKEPRGCLCCKPQAPWIRVTFKRAKENGPEGPLSVHHSALPLWAQRRDSVRPLADSPQRSSRVPRRRRS